MIVHVLWPLVALAAALRKTLEQGRDLVRTIAARG